MQRKVNNMIITSATALAKTIHAKSWPSHNSHFYQTAPFFSVQEMLQGLSSWGEGGGWASPV